MNQQCTTFIISAWMLISHWTASHWTSFTMLQPPTPQTSPDQWAYLHQCLQKHICMSCYAAIPNPLSHTFSWIESPSQWWTCSIAMQWHMLCMRWTLLMTYFAPRNHGFHALWWPGQIMQEKGGTYLEVQHTPTGPFVTHTLQLCKCNYLHTEIHKDTFKEADPHMYSHETGPHLTSYSTSHWSLH